MTLRPAEDAAYAMALPLSVIHNYVRLVSGAAARWNEANNTPVQVGTVDIGDEC